jgi:hypothetical protein
MQPGPRHFQLAVNRGRRDLERGRRFVVGEAAEAEQFDDFALALVVGGETLQRFIERHDSAAYLRTDQYRFIQLDLLGTAATLLPLVGLRVVHQNASQQPRRHRKKMHSVLPRYIRIHQPDVSFMHQRRRPQSVVRPFRPQTDGRQFAELLIYNGQQFVNRLFVSPAPFLQQPGNQFTIWRHIRHRVRLAEVPYLRWKNYSPGCVIFRCVTLGASLRLQRSRGLVSH